MVLSVTAALARATYRSLLRPSFIVLQSMLLFMFQFSDHYSGKKDNVYNILWVLVFGFATLNILALVARRFEPRRSNLQFGEILAITVTVVSVVLLGWEMLSIFHIFPIRLQPH
jgi:glucan phosphoethanolaminetransferase (alkaline phosphatase superfamily)